MSQSPKALRERTGHLHFGLLAIVVESNRMTTSDSILLDAGQTDVHCYGGARSLRAQSQVGYL